MTNSQVPTAMDDAHMTEKTKASEAMEEYKKLCYPPPGVSKSCDETIRQALTLLDRIQRGELKALAREPTETMKNCDAEDDMGSVGTISGYLEFFSAEYIFKECGMPPRP